LSRSAIGINPESNMKAHEDFFLVVLHAYVVAAAEEYLKEYSGNYTSVDLAKKLAAEWVKCFIPASYSDNGQEQSTQSDQPTSSLSEYSSGRSYAIELISLGLIWHGFHDSVKEGDGDRILLYWKFLLPIFKQTNHYNYAAEGFNLLSQVLILSPRKVAELKWSRTVNTHGRVGQNIPCDLHMEHLNREAKSFMGGLGANICNQSVTRIGRALKPLITAMENFDKQHQVPTESGNHTRRSSEKDLQTVLEQIFVKSNVFHFSPGRMHAHFRNFCPNTMTTVTEENFKKWMEHRAKELLTYH